MSRSRRKYRGLSHTQSDTKQGKAWKKIWKRQDRARAKAMADDDVVPLPCHRSNCYNGDLAEEDYECMASRRSKGYSPKRMKHRIWGK